MSISVKDKRIALVGGAGFIGHNLALALKENDADVHVIDSLQVNHFGSIHGNPDTAKRDIYLSILNERMDLMHKAGIPLRIVDARDYHLLSQALEQIKPQVLIHLAAIAHANQSNKDPHSTFDHSLRTLENSLDNARSLDLEQFIYLSSSMIYGHFLDGEVTEETQLDPIGIYGALKFSGEKMVIAYNQVFNLPYTIIRPSALYGQRCVSGRVGQIFIENALEGKQITIQGDGSDRLDFTYIKEFVNGLMLAMSTKKAINQIFNLTTGNARKLSDMADILKQYFPEAEIHHAEWDRLTPKRGTLSIKKAQTLLGYESQYQLEQGFVEYIDWYKSMKLDEAPGEIALVTD